MISKERIAGSWHDILANVKETFGQITNADLRQVRGNADQLIDLIQRKTGRSRRQVEHFLEDCADSATSSMHHISESAAKYASEAGDMMRDNYKRLAADAERGYDYSVQTFRRRPVESVAIAIGIGLFAGVLIGVSACGQRRS